MLILGRVVAGIGVGITSAAGPAFISVTGRQEANFSWAVGWRFRGCILPETNCSPLRINGWLEDELSNEKNLGWLIDIGDEILPRYMRGLFHKPLQGSLVNNQYLMESAVSVFFFFVAQPISTSSTRWAPEPMVAVTNGVLSLKKPYTWPKLHG